MASKACAPSSQLFSKPGPRCASSALWLLTGRALHPPALHKAYMLCICARGLTPTSRGWPPLQPSPGSCGWCRRRLSNALKLHAQTPRAWSKSHTRAGTRAWPPPWVPACRHWQRSGTITQRCLTSCSWRRCGALGRGVWGRALPLGVSAPLAAAGSGWALDLLVGHSLLTPDPTSLGMCGGSQARSAACY